MWSSFSQVGFFVIPWTVAFQALLSMEFSRQEYWSEEPFPSLEDLPNPGIPGVLHSRHIIYCLRNQRGFIYTYINDKSDDKYDLIWSLMDKIMCVSI